MPGADPADDRPPHLPSHPDPLAAQGWRSDPPLSSLAQHRGLRDDLQDLLPSHDASRMIPPGPSPSWLDLGRRFDSLDLMITYVPRRLGPVKMVLTSDVRGARGSGPCPGRDSNPRKGDRHPLHDARPG